MPTATSLGRSDTPCGFTCKQKMHGGLVCAISENENDHSDKMYCKNCWRSGDAVVVNSGATNNHSSSDYNGIVNQSGWIIAISHRIITIVSI